MADKEETILLHFDIDEQPAVQSIKDLRQANSQLRAERDKVNISTKEGQELVQKLNVAIDKNNKVIKDNSSALEKQRQNVGNYSKSIQEAAGNLNIMGTNVGQLGSKLTTFLNPATAAVGVVTALGAAYANSTAGAKDLEFVQGQLSATTTILTNAFADMITSAEDGEGALTKLFNGLLESFGPAGVALSQTTKALTLAQKAIEDLARAEIEARGNVAERLGENQELLTEINAEQTTLNRKLELADFIESNILKNGEELKTIKQQQLESAEAILAADSANEEKSRNVIVLGRELKKIQLDEDKKLKGIRVLRDNILSIEQKRVQTARDQDTLDKERARNAEREAQRAKDRAQTDAGLNTGLGNVPPAVITAQQIATATAKSEEDIRNEVAKTTQFQKEQLKERLDFATTILSQVTGLFQENTIAYKVLAATDAVVNTYKAANLALGSFPPPLSFALAAASIATGLANVTKLNAAAGGGDFVTTKPTLLMVGDNPGGRERVTVEPLSGKGQTRVNPRSGLLQMAGGGSLTVNDGGFVANSNSLQSQQSLIMANAIKNLPAPVVGVVEITKMQNRVSAKEKVTRQ